MKARDRENRYCQQCDNSSENVHFSFGIKKLTQTVKSIGPLKGLDNGQAKKVNGLP